MRETVLNILVSQTPVLAETFTNSMGCSSPRSNIFSNISSFADCEAITPTTHTAGRRPPALKHRGTRHRHFQSTATATALPHMAPLAASANKRRTFSQPKSIFYRCSHFLGRLSAAITLVVASLLSAVVVINTLWWQPRLRLRNYHYQFAIIVKTLTSRLFCNN